MPHADRTNTPPDGADEVSAAPPFSTVLVPLDGSSFGESVLPHVRVLARMAGSGVHLLSVLGPEPGGRSASASAEMRLQVVEAEQYLESVADRLRESGLEVETEVRTGRPAEEIVRAAGRSGADLVALAARPRREEAHIVSRGVAQTVMAAGVASVLVARGDGIARLPAPWREARYRTLLAPVDGSAPSERALGVAAAVARAEEADLHTLRVEPDGRSGEEGGGRGGAHVAAGAEAGSWTARLKRPGDAVEAGELTEVSRAVRCPGVPQAVEEIAARVDPDLVVCAAHGAGEAEGPYGHCAEWLLLHADAPILVLQDRPVRPGEAGTRRPGIRHDRRAGRTRSDPRVRLTDPSGPRP